MRHLTDLSRLDDAGLAALLDLSLDRRADLDEGRAVPPRLAGRLQFNLFYEDSTRTNLSFETAAMRLGAMVSVVPVAASSVHKGESLRDTVLTLCAQGADILVLRSGESGAVSTARDAADDAGFGTAIVNAGEGAFGHPTQALLDAATLMHATGRRAVDGLRGLTVAICGDVAHSRVAASTAPLFVRLGATVRLIGPPELLPTKPFLPEIAMTTDRSEGLDGADVVMPLRVQKERMPEDRYTGSADYHQDYGISWDALAAASPGAFVMHPGPMNRGVEIDSAVADDPDRSLILSQVRQGVATRMAVLETLKGR
ncbi:aspartate carbamoyltransferase catalytic subunit [Parvularcula dongshanensis]|uniref:Aspartate carbamoyltransferase n=1 Tax=Parvularcula dongshanensis TaxID=1173995 RepID=A0A840I5D7_9PROT|nr:aspartate carbamoyltransferase catalytic subunit [Parvularcula dongshanensis]MBB4659378.1 aspartate carbamoyltransferase catalytic subunit [Parvularcula dongshanensis]